MNEQLEVTTHLNKAAYLLLNGGRLIGYVGKYWSNCKLTVIVDKQVYLNAKKGVVKYQSYMALRSKLKMKMKKWFNVL